MTFMGDVGVLLGSFFHVCLIVVVFQKLDCGTNEVNIFS